MPHHRFASLPLATITLAMALSSARAQRTSAPITPADLKARVGIIADDSTMGRETGSRGDDAAARYVERELRRLGLSPAGDSGGFFQRVPIVSRRFDRAASTLSVGEMPLRIDRDYLPLPALGALHWGSPRVLSDVEVVYGGTWDDTLHRLDSARASGRLVVLRTAPGAGSRGGLALFAGAPAHLAGAAGIALVGLEQLPDHYRDFLAQPRMRIDDGKRDSSAVMPLLLVTGAAAMRLVGQPLSGARIGDVGRRVSLRFLALEGPTELPARNVIAVLRGTEPRLRRSYVSISAHHDHVGFSRVPVDHDSLHAYRRDYERLRQANPRLQVADEDAAAIHVDVGRLRASRPARLDSIFNGADDDASGTAALLEIAERLATGPIRPRRSILFLSHTGEERGLLGSGWFSDHPTVGRDSIVATIDMDMIGRGSAADLSIGGPEYLELIGTRRQSTEFGDIIDSTNAHRRQPFRINYAFDAHDHPEGDWCRADHYSLARYGIPAAAFSTSYHGDYHQVTDEAQYLDYPHLANIAGFVGDVALALARLDHRPLLDHPRPADPNARCVQ